MSRRDDARDYHTTQREQGHRVATAKDKENARNSQGKNNAAKAIKDRATGNPTQRRH
jgi:hypothetical protein